MTSDIGIGIGIAVGLGTGFVNLGPGVQILSLPYNLAVLQSISLFCITYSIIKGQLLSNHADMVWGVKDALSRRKV